MKEFRNGDVALVGLQPYLDEYALIKYVDYACYFPWLRKNSHIIFTYKYTTFDPFDQSIPLEHKLQPFSNPIAVKYYGVPNNIRFVRNNPPNRSESLPSLFFKSNLQFFDQLLKKEPASVKKPENVFLFSTALGLYSHSQVSCDLYGHLEFEEAYLTREIKYRIALDVMLDRGYSIKDMYRLSQTSELRTADRILALTNVDKKAKPSISVDSHLFHLPNDKQTKYPSYIIDKNYLTFNFQIYIPEFSEIFEKNNLIANHFGWILLFDYLSQDRTYYDFEHDGFNYILTREEDTKTLAKVIDKAISDPDFVDATLAKIPISLREKYFPSAPICLDSALVNMDVATLEAPSNFLQILRVKEGTKTRYQIEFQVEDLFKTYNALFEQYGSYANGYGWEALVIQEFLPEKVDDQLDMLEPILDPEAAAVTISFKKKKDCMALAEWLGSFLQDRQRIERVLQKMAREK